MTVIINFDIGASFYLDHYGIEYIFLNQKYNNNFKDINHNYNKYFINPFDPFIVYKEFEKEYIELIRENRPEVIFLDEQLKEEKKILNKVQTTVLIFNTQVNNKKIFFPPKNSKTSYKKSIFFSLKYFIEHLKNLLT
jgi:hypothetical protein